jgi:hypothetical protein
MSLLYRKKEGGGYQDGGKVKASKVSKPAKGKKKKKGSKKLKSLTSTSMY